MTRSRQRIGAQRIEDLLAASLDTAQRGGAVAAMHLKRVTIDRTVQPKAMTHLTDSKLLRRGIENLVRLVRRHGVSLRQRLSKSQVSRSLFVDVSSTPGPSVANQLPA
jgi:IS5 family transposase